MADKETNAAEVLKQRDADEKEIISMVSAGLDRSQATAALQHKKEFSARFAEHQEATAPKKEAAPKK